MIGEMGTTKSKPDSAARQIEGVAAQGEVLGQELLPSNVIGRHVNPVENELRIAVVSGPKRVERRRRICIQQRDTQCVVVHNAAETFDAVILIVTNTEIPFP